jgi:hypothetical protein
MQLKTVNRGRFGRPPTNRTGRNQRSAWRALVGYADGRPMTTAELFGYIYPGLTDRQPRWRWYAVRLAAERHMVRVEPRTRPLRWIAKPELLDKL